MNQDLYELNKKIWKCRRCSRLFSPSQPGYFPDNLEILFIGRNPGQLYVRKSGWNDYDFIDIQDFDKFQKEYYLGLKESPVGKFILRIMPKEIIWGLTNICKCRSPNDSLLSKEEIENCRFYLQQQILISKPKSIVIMGSQPFNWWFPKYRIKDYVNTIQYIKLSYSDEQIPMLILYHPSSRKCDPVFIREKIQILL